MRNRPVTSNSSDSRPATLAAPLGGEPAPLSSDIDEIVAYMRHIAQRDRYEAPARTLS